MVMYMSTNPSKSTYILCIFYISFSLSLTHSHMISRYIHVLLLFFKNYYIFYFVEKIYLLKFNQEVNWIGANLSDISSWSVFK